MFKPKKKDLNQPVTLGVFMEYVNFFSDNVAMKKDIDASTEKILSSNDKVIKNLDTVLTEQAAISGNLDQYRDEVKDHKQRIERLEAHAGIS